MKKSTKKSKKQEKPVIEDKEAEQNPPPTVLPDVRLNATERARQRVAASRQAALNQAILQEDE